MNLNTSIGDLELLKTEAVALYTTIGIYGGLLLCGIVPITLFLAAQIKGRSTLSESIFSCVILVDFTDQGIMYFTLLMSLNRFAVFVWTPMQQMFSSQNINKVIYVTWFYVLCITTTRQIFGSKKKFNKKTLNIEDVFLTQSGNLYIQIVSISTYAIPILIMFIYIIIFAFLRKKRSESNYQRDDNDKSLLVQAFTVSIILEFTRVVSVVAPMLKTETLLQWILNIMRSICSVVNHTLNPLLFLLTNKTIQAILKTFIRKPIINGLASDSTNKNGVVMVL